MPCYNSIDGEPASVSHRLLTELLRERMGFDGLCISDYGGISNAHEVQRIGETIGETGFLAMEAGMDMEMPKAIGYGEKLKEMFRSGQADTELLNRTVLRVLEAKFRMGLFEQPFAMDGESCKKIFEEKEGAELSLRSARESMVLLKNNGVLPLSGKIKKLALIGPHADCARKFFGGYTHLCMMESVYAAASSIAGVEGSPESGQIGGAMLPDGEPVNYVPGTKIQSDEAELFNDILRLQKPGCRSLLEELKERMTDTEILYVYGYPVAGKDQSRFEEALQAVREADVVILTLGGKHGTCSMATMGEGVNAADINLQECQDAFIKAASVYGKPLIGIHFDGRPISSDTADQYLDAVIEAWSPAETGAQAVADVLLGAYNPGGKLPVSVAYHAGQIPIYYNHPNGSAWHQQESIGFVNYVDVPHTPRYCFGHGLSYTQFEYDMMKNHPEINIVDFNLYNVEAFNRCENNNEVLLAFKSWESVHPLIRIIPVEWDYTMPFRANYNDLKNGVHETTEYLELFLRNLLLDEKNELHNRSMHISGRFKETDFESAKADIGNTEADTESQKANIRNKLLAFSDMISEKTINHTFELFSKCGKEEYFGRTIVEDITGLKSTRASELIKLLVDSKVIVSVTGHGKGKYRFQL